MDRFVVNSQTSDPTLLELPSTSVSSPLDYSPEAVVAKQDYS
jgi:hypothetical protein